MGSSGRPVQMIKRAQLGHGPPKGLKPPPALLVALLVAPPPLFLPLPPPPAPRGRVTAAPSRRRSPPSVITSSPTARPEATEEDSPLAGPVLTARCFTVLSVCSTQTKSPLGPCRMAVVGTIT